MQVDISQTTPATTYKCLVGSYAGNIATPNPGVSFFLSYLSSQQTNEKNFWSNKYKEITSPPWNLDSVHPELKTTLPQLKLPKSRVLVPGCGFGHDAAFLAEQGHIVTGIDFSEEAISKAKEQYGHIKNLTFEVNDAEFLDKFFLCLQKKSLIGADEASD